MGSRRELCQISVSRQQSSTITFNLAHIWIGKFSVKPSVLFVITFRLPTMDSIKICRAKNCRDIGHLTGVGVKKTHVTCLAITFRRGSWQVSSLLNRLLIRTAHLLKATKCFNLFVVVHQRIFQDKNCNVKEGGLDGSYVRILKLILILLI